ncbi:putative Histidine kinase [Syntrophobacter sp. SbD1]|nr:putative Histidine kinase [Syntrophobacter sp. SbD1]
MPTILIVDDKEANLFALENTLKRLDVSIVRASSGNEALRATLDNDFALVILDVQMPEMDGYELAALLRGDERSKNVPIIFLSAEYSDEPSVFRGYESGGVDFIIKPFNPAILISKVKVFLELYEQKAVLAIQKATLERSVKERTAELVRTNAALVQEVIERKEKESWMATGNLFFKLLNEAVSRKQYLDAAVEKLRERSGCTCVGIRILGRGGTIPYESYIGFSQDFWEKENELLLSSDNCACTRVITGTIELQDMICMTPGGSFHCNNSNEFVSGLSEFESSRYRGECIRSGFKSIAIIPVQYNGKILGAIHLADREEGKVPDRLIERFESISSIVGETIYKLNEREKLQESYEFQNVIQKLLRISLKDFNLDEFLDRALNALIAVPSPPFETKGCIFIAGAESCSLLMKANCGFPEETMIDWAQVSPGRCPCGLSVDPGGTFHENLFGHYSVPIISADKMLGMLTIAVKPGHYPEEKEQEFLRAFVAALTGILTRKQAETALAASEHKYRELVENADSIIIKSDPRGKIVFLNEFAQKFFGYREDEIIGKGWLETILPETDSSGRNLIEMSEKILKCPDEFESNENENIKRSGKRVWVSWKNKAILNERGDFVELLSVGTDITKRKTAENKLRAYTKQLTSLNKELEEFFFIASHDLKEPLRKIQTFGNRLSIVCKGSITDEGEAHLEKISNAAKRMSELIAALLRYTHTAVRPITFGNTDLNKVAQNAINDLQKMIDEVSARVDFSDLPILAVDRNQMRQLFQQLITNALKFRRKEELPRIKISAHVVDGTCEILVEDNGIGFEEIYLNKIFMPFQQLHGRGKYDGTGMGLAVCRKIAERHRGGITARSTPGEGSTFIVMIPLEQKPNAFHSDTTLRRGDEQLVHELRVHQIELEMQNDELRNLQVQLEESHARYVDLYDFAPVGYITFDKDGLILQANMTAATQLGIERGYLINKPIWLYAPGADRDVIHAHFKKVFNTRERQTCEVRLRAKGGVDFYARLESIFIGDSDGMGRCRTSIIDISRSKTAEEVLKRAYNELERRVEELTAEVNSSKR